MAWILIEGLDRSGKTTVTEYYKKQGFEVIHMDAPDSKHFQPGYSGPSYLEEIVDMYSIYDGKDVVFDRTIYGEYIWPEIYNRMPLLNEEDVEYLSRLEYNNSATKILMYDENVEAHWQRCVDNNEPLNRLQFVQASRLYDKLAQKHNFKKMQLGEFDFDTEITNKKETSPQTANRDTNNNGNTISNESSEHASSDPDRDVESLDQRLGRANAIRALLKTKIIKKSASEYRQLEEDIKKFLTNELENIFTPKQERHFTNEEVSILKLYAQRIVERSGLKE
jgi:hypothetical protein